MLTKEELSLAELVFHTYAHLNFLPITFDQRTGRISLASTWRRVAWAFNLFVFALIVIFLNCRLLQATLMPEYYNPIHFSIHFLTATFLTLCACYGWQFFVSSPGSTIKIYNEMISHLREGKDWRQIIFHFDSNNKIRSCTATWCAATVVLYAQNVHGLRRWLSEGAFVTACRSYS